MKYILKPLFDEAFIKQTMSWCVLHTNHIWFSIAIFNMFPKDAKQYRIQCWWTFVCESFIFLLSIWLQSCVYHFAILTAVSCRDGQNRATESARSVHVLSFVMCGCVCVCSFSFSCMMVWSLSTTTNLALDLWYCNKYTRM